MGSLRFSRGSSQPRSPTLQEDSLPAEPPGKPAGSKGNKLQISLECGGLEAWIRNVLPGPHKYTCTFVRKYTHTMNASPGISSSPIMLLGGPAFPGTAGLSLWLGWSTRIERTLSRGRARTMARVSSRMGNGENRSLRCRARRRHPAWPDRARRLSSRRKILEPRPMAGKTLDQSWELDQG